MDFRFDIKGNLLTEIAHADICDQAAFRLDKPMVCTTDDVFELRNGEWFHLTSAGEEKIEGRWVMPKIELIPEKQARQSAKTVMVNVPKE